MGSLSVASQLTLLFLHIAAGPSIPPAVSYTKRPQANSVESEQKEDWDKDTARRLGSTMVGSKSEVTASPLVGPDRKKSSTGPSVSQSSPVSQLDLMWHWDFVKALSFVFLNVSK